MSRIGTVMAIVSLAVTAWAADVSLDSNGMSALNHARYDLDDCERFTELKKSGGIEYDYIDQILAGKTSHTPEVASRIKEIRKQYKQIARQLGKAKIYRNREVVDRTAEYDGCEERDPPYTVEIREITAYYHRDNLIMIGWTYHSNAPRNDTTSVFLDSAQRPMFAFRRWDDQSWRHSQNRFYYDETGKTIAVAIRSGQANDWCESRSMPSMDMLKNYPAPLDERENPIERMGKLDKMVCTAKKQPGCKYFRLGEW